MDIRIEGNGINLEITIENDGKTVTNALVLQGGEWVLKKLDGSPGAFIAQGRVGLPEALKRAIDLVAHAAGVANL